MVMIPICHSVWVIIILHVKNGEIDFLTPTDSRLEKNTFFGGGCFQGNAEKGDADLKRAAWDGTNG
jgi:hypothetical protein